MIPRSSYRTGRTKISLIYYLAEIFPSKEEIYTAIPYISMPLGESMNPTENWFIS